ADFNGTATINYEATDGNGGFGAATVTVTVNPVNDDPTPVNDTISTPEDTPVTFDVLSNDTDPDGDPLSVASATMAAGDEEAGSVIVEPDNRLTFTPSAEVSGNFTIEYTATDGNGGNAVANVLVNVTPVNDPPEITGQNPLSVDEDNSLTLFLADFQTNDPEGDPLTLTVQDGVNYSRSGNQVTPDLNFNGSLAVNVVVDDGEFTSDVFSATVTVNAVNDVPTLDIIFDPAAIPEDSGEQTIGLSGISDGDGGVQTLTVTAVSDNTALIPDPVVTYTNPDPTGSLSYTPVANQSGSATITVTVDDGEATDNTVVRSFFVVVNPVLDDTVFVSVASGADSPSCGFEIATACASIRQGVENAAAESVLNLDGLVTVKVEAGTYTVDGADDANAVILAPNVPVSGSWNAAFDTQDFDTNVTILQSNGTGDGDSIAVPAPLRCPAGVGTNVFVEALRVLGSTTQTASGTAAAVRVEGGCSAQFRNNTINGRGNATVNASYGVVLGQANAGPHPQALFIGNKIYAGQAAGNTFGVLALGSDGAGFVANFIEGGQSTSGEETAVHNEAGEDSAETLSFTELLILENNVLSAQNFGVNTGGTRATRMHLFNNTVLGTDAPFAVQHPSAEVSLVNNIFVAGAFEQPSQGPCVVKDGNTQAWNLDHNIYTNCAFGLSEASGSGAVSVNSIELPLAEGISFNNYDLDYGINQGLFSSNAGGDALTVRMDLSLHPSTVCEGQIGGLAGPAPIDDIDGNGRHPLIDGVCALGEFPAQFGEGITAGAYEFEVPALYVASGGLDSNDCLTPATACATLGHALSIVVPGTEIRISDGVYTASAGTGLAKPALINKAHNIIGGYDPSFIGSPTCVPGDCGTQLNLLENASGTYEQTVLRCDGQAGSAEMGTPNTLIAGLNIDASDSNDANETYTRGLLLHNGCNAAITSNVISGGNGGNDGSDASEGVAIEDANTAPLIVANWISGGVGSTGTTVAIRAANGTTPSIQENELKGNSDNNAAAPNAAKSIGILLGNESGALGGQTGFAQVTDNTVEGGFANTAQGVFVNGFGDVNMERNLIHGGVSQATLTTGVEFATDGTVSLINNLIHGGDASSGSIARALLFATINATSSYTAQHNSIWIGTQGTSTTSSVQFHAANGALTVTFDNNIVGGDDRGGASRICVEEFNADTVPVSFTNNSLYACSNAAYSDFSAGNLSVAALNSSANNASANVGFDPLYVDFDGSDNDPGSADFDFSLDGASPCEVVAGGRTDVPVFDDFTNDFNVFRTALSSNPSLGYSIGAYEFDDDLRCDGGA
ncbi:MAG: tandem-95 repeat protein, partial [Gammaproteobacteria bacterium]|nr:tandem-95 repeat protein [Gammaproteobacteria bacterium]